MDYSFDKRTVMTLDAGGTNLVFTAIRGNKQITGEIVLPTYGDDLDKCLSSIVDGFQQVRKNLQTDPVAISFAFPGPADYPNGIIGDLPNLPAFRGGVALGPMLEEKFSLPVFINNDGDLYTFGEAIAGFLPSINNLLMKAGSPKRYKNLLGLTLGTGFGAGIVHDGNLYTGDNSNAGEIWLFRDKLSPLTHIEEHASIHGVRKVYAREAHINLKDSPTPKDIYDICMEKKQGNKNAALRAYREMGEAVGDAVSSAVSLIDGLVVIGGGLSGASIIFLPYIINEMNSEFIKPDGTRFRRLSSMVYNLEDEEQLSQFISGGTKELSVYNSKRKVIYDPEMRIGVGISKIGTNKAISIGAYSIALQKIDG